MTHWHAKGTACAVVFALVLVVVVPKAFGLDVAGYATGYAPAQLNSLSVDLQTAPISVFKVRLRVNTKSSSLKLCAGDGPALVDGTCPLTLASAVNDASGNLRDGLGFIGTDGLQGKFLYVINPNATANSVVSFTVTIE